MNAKIGYFVHAKSGCYYYRIEQKMEALNAHGIKTEKLELNKDLDDGFTAFQFYGAYPFSMEPVLKYCKENKVKIVYDTDDALNLIESNSPFYHSVMRDKGSALELLSYADEVTVSTPEMAKYVISLHYQGKITVLPNCYDENMWKHIKPPHEGIRIGFAGSASHVKDLITILPTIKLLQNKYNIQFYIMGFGQYDYITWMKQFRYIATDEATKYLFELDRLLKDMTFEWVPFVDYDKYPQKLTELSLDFGLCPLENTPFNTCRSGIKAIEYILAGALPLASNLPAYHNDQCSILVNENQWFDKLEYCIKNPQDVLQKKLEFTHWIKENRDIHTQIPLLKEIYGSTK